MLKIEKVLFPTDLSRTSLNAVPMAAHLAKIHGADLHMLHVHILHSLINTDDDPPFPGEEEARQILEESVPEFSWSRVYHHVSRDIAAAPSILGFAREYDVDLIVMASHGRRGLRRMLLGSVAEEVVRLAERPVMVIRDTETVTAEKGFERVLVPVDFSNHAENALQVGAELAATFNARLDILHVLERPQYSEMQYPQPINEADLRAYAEDRMEALLKTCDTAVQCRHRIVSGYAADEIVAATDRVEGTLVVMPSHGLSGMERLLLGSVTERVLRRAQSPVLVLRALGQNPRQNGDVRASAVAMTGV
jgi:nucleotide-binding universal stress UspA family protein